MVQKDTIIYELTNFVNSKLDVLSKDNPLFNMVIRPYIEEVISVNIDKIDNILTPITRSDGMININGIIDNITDRILVSQLTKINGIEIGNGVIKINIPIMNKSILLTKEDFKDFKNRLEKYENDKRLNTPLQNNA